MDNFYLFFDLFTLLGINVLKEALRQLQSLSH